MTSHERAEWLMTKAERAGLDNPTQDMIAAAIQDAECDALTIPMTVATKNCGWQDGGDFLKAMRLAVGELAEHAAHDLDHYGKTHAKWYQAVTKARKYLAIP